MIKETKRICKTCLAEKELKHFWNGSKECKQCHQQKEKQKRAERWAYLGFSTDPKIY